MPRRVALARRLVAGADVFVTNLRPDALAKLGLDWASLEPRCPRLVYASITGYGLRGPERDRAAYDVGAFWARTGAEHIMFPPGVEPHGIRGGFGDHVTALSLVSGIMAALLPARAHRPRAAGRDVALAHGPLLRGLGHRHPPALRHGGAVAAAHARAEPGAEPVPERRRALVLAARARGRAALAEAGARGRSPGVAGGRALRRRALAAQELARADRRARPRVRRAPARRVGGEVRRRRSVVGAGAQPGRGRRGSAGPGDERHRLGARDGRRRASSRRSRRRSSSPPRRSARRARPRSWASTPTRCSRELGLSADEIRALRQRGALGK